MRLVKNARGFEALMTAGYLPPHQEMRVIGESSAVGDYADSFDKPGSSFLWVGEGGVRLNREEVAELVGHMQRWLKTGRLG